MCKLLVVVAVAMTSILSAIACACPLCPSVGQTLTEQMQAMEAVVIAKMIDVPSFPADGLVAGMEIPKAKLEVISIVKGDKVVEVKQVVQTPYLGEGKLGDTYLVMAITDADELVWTTPLRVNSEEIKYVRDLETIPPAGGERLLYFKQYLDSDAELMSRDAYDEFARAPYADVIALKSQMDSKQLLSWIRNADVPANRRRLYFMMLGVCGTEKDIPTLEEMVKSPGRKQKAGLDAMIACYLTLKGPDGLKLINELFFANPEAEYSETYQAIMALRFHGTESKRIPRAELCKSFHYILDRPPIADLVLPDLARWEDWSQIKKAVELFKTADEKSSWVRVPVVNYLHVCPLPEAKEYIKELEKIDPGAVKRSSFFFPGGREQQPKVEKD